VIADNQLALNAGWDRELLGLELGELKLGGFDLALTGFGELELGDLLADRAQGLTDPDDAPEASEHPVSRTGDLWLLGRHRLLCGNSTVATDIERVLGGVEPHLMVTDPPYGVEYDPKWRNGLKRAGVLDGTPSTSIGKVENDHLADWHEAWALFPGDPRPPASATIAARCRHQRTRRRGASPRAPNAGQPRAEADVATPGAAAASSRGRR